MGRAIEREQAARRTYAIRPITVGARQIELAALVLLLLVALASRLILPAIEPEDAAPRVIVALGHVALLAGFYVACRVRCSSVAALATTALLGFGDWTLATARGGDLAVISAACAVLALLALERAVAGKLRWPWVAAGLLAGAGWCAGPAGAPILPALLAPLLTRLARPAERGRIVGAGALLAATFLLTVFPSVAPLLGRQDEVAASLASWPALDGAGPAEATRLLVGRAGQVVRAYFLLDPTAGAPAAMLPPGRAVLDAFSGTLFLIGLIVAVRVSAPGLWWSLLVVPLLLVQLPGGRVPDPSLAITALPAFFLFVGLAIDRITRVAPLRPILLGALLVAVPAIGWTNWQAYAGRAPATGSAGGATAARPGPISATPLLTIASPGRAPRGVAVLDGVVFVVDATGRLSRLTPGAGTLVDLPGRSDGPAGGDLAAGPDGFLYLSDAERNAVTKLNPNGDVVRTLGQGWGMYRPRGLAVTADGRLLVADTGRDRILVATTDGQLVRSIGGPTAPGLLDQPTDVAMDSAGRIYAALPESGRVVVLDESGVGLGGWSIERDGTIDSPRLAVTADGAIGVSEPSARRVRFFDPEGRQLGEIATGVRLPLGLATDGDRLYAADPGAALLLVFTLGPP